MSLLPEGAGKILLSAVPLIHQISITHTGYDRRIGQTIMSPLAESGVYLGEIKGVPSLQA